LGPEPIDERAWTLQERLLSPRTLEFGVRQLLWICQKAPDDNDYIDGWRRDPEPYAGRKDRLDQDIGLEFEVFRHKLREVDEADINPDELTRRIQAATPGITVDQDPIRKWYRLIEIYTRRKLSDPKDRILAISGLAASFDEILKDKYLAGLWRSTLHWSLLWQFGTDGDNSRAPRPKEYQGPSWSWTSISNHVLFPVGVTSDDPWYGSGPEIIECSPKLVDSRAPSGAYCEGSRLVLRARLLPGIAAVANKGGRDPSIRHSLMVPAMNDKGGFESISWTRDDAQLDERESLLLLEFWSHCGEQRWGTKGLVLKCVEDNAFSRLGIFDHISQNGRQGGESLED
jgi:hypothetical protein